MRTWKDWKKTVAEAQAPSTWCKTNQPRCLSLRDPTPFQRHCSIIKLDSQRRSRAEIEPKAFRDISGGIEHRWTRLTVSWSTASGAFSSSLQRAGLSTLCCNLRGLKVRLNYTCWRATNTGRGNTHVISDTRVCGPCSQPSRLSKMTPINTGRDHGCCVLTSP